MTANRIASLAHGQRLKSGLVDKHATVFSIDDIAYEHLKAHTSLLFDYGGQNLRQQTLGMNLTFVHTQSELVLHVFIAHYGNLPFLHLVGQDDNPQFGTFYDLGDALEY